MPVRFVVVLMFVALNRKTLFEFIGPYWLQRLGASAKTGAKSMASVTKKMFSTILRARG